MSRPTVAVFRPADQRLERGVRTLENLGVEPVPDPMLAVEPTGTRPTGEADVVVFTSKTGVELAVESGWTPEGQRVCAIGPATADTLEAAGVPVDLVPEEYTSSGLVRALTERGGTTDGTIEIARSDHGSEVLLEGLRDAGATVTETVLYRLVKPANAGHSAELAAAGELDGAVFTSSLTVEHFLEAARERSVAARDGLEEAVVGVIGVPTRETAREHGVPVDVVASEATFDCLASETVAELQD